MTMRVRAATLADVPQLLQLEAECWQPALRADEATIVQRIRRYPAGQWVAERQDSGLVVGVIYSQRITSSDDLKTGSFATQENLHTTDGTILQLLAIAVKKTSPPSGNVAAVLRNHVLDLSSGFSSVVTMARCNEFLLTHSQVFADAQQYTDAYNTYVSEACDSALLFHIAGGAQVVCVVLNYRPEDDVANGGHAVLMQYAPPPVSDLKKGGLSIG
jgi:hypothetical protein